MPEAGVTAAVRVTCAPRSNCWEEVASAVVVAIAATVSFRGFGVLARKPGAP